MENFYQADADYVVSGKSMNEIAGAVNWVRRRNGAGGSAGSAAAGTYAPGEVWGRSDAALGAFTAVKLGALAVTPETADGWAYGAQCFSVAATSAGDAADSSATIGLTVEPVTAGNVARVLLQGLTPAKVIIEGGTACTHAVPGAGGVLTGGSSGNMRIVNRVALTGETASEYWCVLQLGAGGGDGEKKQVTLTDSAISVTMQPNTVYTCTTALVGVYLDTAAVGWNESVVIFTVGAGFGGVSVSSGTQWAWGRGRFREGQKYCLSVAGGIINMAEVN